MEDILLRHTSVWTERIYIKLAVKVGVNRSLHPNINGEGIKVAKAKKGNAGGNLVADAAYFLQTFEGVSEAPGGGNHIKPYPAVGYSFAGIENIAIAEAGVGWKQPFGFFEDIRGRGEGIAPSAFAAFFFTRGAVNLSERTFCKRIM